MFRFVIYAVPLLLVLFALFGWTVDLFGIEPGGNPAGGAVFALRLSENPHLPMRLVLGVWVLQAVGLMALFLLAEGRCGAWWLDGLATGWVAWIFRGPLLVITLVVAAGQSQAPWWRLAFGWWVLYSLCGLGLAILARRLRGAGAGASGAVSDEPALAAPVTDT